MALFLNPEIAKALAPMAGTMARPHIRPWAAWRGVLFGEKGSAAPRATPSPRRAVQRKDELVAMPP